METMDEKYVFVRFADRESKFLFPSAFEKGYLSCTEWEDENDVAKA